MHRPGEEHSRWMKQQAQNLNVNKLNAFEKRREK
jgi:hypothetical protein